MTRFKFTEFNEIQIQFSEILIQILSRLARRKLFPDFPRSR